ncbi:hypothetical protein M0R04_11985 [Candidatus Dojkabacteria bacterium]|nr:hypothetical protein [Candidatus Dojkabacteria bacterium]
MSFKIILIWLIVTIVSAILYRLGGWIKSWLRDWLIPLLLYGTIVFFSVPSHFLGYICLIIAILLTGLALTTYYDSLFGFDNFWFHGFMIGLGAFPLIWYGSIWYLILVRAIILAITFGLLNWWVNKKQIKYSDWIEELSRGFLILATFPLLLRF